MRRTVVWSTTCAAFDETSCQATLNIAASAEAVTFASVTATVTLTDGPLKSFCPVRDHSAVFVLQTKWQKRSISVAKCLCLYGEQRYVVQSEHHSCAAKSVSLVKSSYLCKTACFPRHLDGQSLWCIHSLRNGYVSLGAGVGQSGCGCEDCDFGRGSAEVRERFI